MQKCQMHTSPSWCEFVVLRFFCFHDKKIYNTTSYLHEQQFKIDFPSLPPCNMGLAKLNVKSPPIVWTPYTHTNDLREGGTNTTLSLRSQYSTKLTLNLVYIPLKLQTPQCNTNHNTFPWHCHVSLPHWLGPSRIPCTSLHGKRNIHIRIHIADRNQGFHSF